MDEKKAYLMSLIDNSIDKIDYSGSYEEFVERYKTYRLYLLRHEEFFMIVKKAHMLDEIHRFYEDDGK